jgi:hypothetical protein
VTVECLTQRLGAPTETSTSNTVGHRWAFDTAFASLLTWPPELQRTLGLTNPAHEKHPEMLAFCHLTFGAGHVVPLAAQEREWMTGARPLVPESKDAVGLCPGLASLSSPLRGSLRRLPAELSTRRGFVAISADSAALVGMDGDAGFVLPKELVVAVDLHRIAPARGPAGSRLHMRYRDSFSSERVERSREIFVGASPTSLDATAGAVARWAEVQAVVSEYSDD